MVFQVRTTQTANAEIEAAYSWLRERNRVYADKWFRELMDTIATLPFGFASSLRRETLLCPSDTLREQDWTHKKSHDAAL